MSRSVALGTSLFVSGFSVIGVKNYYTSAVVKKHTVALPGLPVVFNGFKIVQISDLHIGQMMTGAKLKEIVAQVNSLRLDLIAITGDLVDGNTDKLLDEVAGLKNLKANWVSTL
jgi:predicted MPP superfamily phosphohydrolase